MHWVDSGAETPPSGEEAAPVPAESAGPWSMGDASFVLSIDRITGLLAWNKAETIQVTDNSFSGNGMKHPVDIKSSGIDASFLTAGTGRTASAIPRLGFDLLTRAGVTLGGSLGYMSSTGKLEASEVNAEHDLGDIAVFVFSFRLGYLLQTSDNFGFWLRGGLTRVSVKASLPIVDRNGVLSTFEDTSTMWNVTLDPQLMFVVAPHVAITLGGLLDIGFTGTDESEFNVDSPPPLTSSAYGVTAGFAVLL